MFKVETAIGSGWENTWLDENENPQTFPTEAHAQAELDEFFQDQAGAVADGFMGDVYERSDYRIVEVDDED